MVIGDHPELIEYNNCTIGVGGNNTTDILILNKIPDNLQVRRIINDKTSLIIQECISSNMTVIQRVLSIYKYFIEHIQYDYFCLTDDDLNNRKWNKKNYPKCNSNRYNYFDIMNAVVYTVKEFVLIVKENMKNKRDIYVKLNFDKPLSVEEISILIQQIGESINYWGSYTIQYNDDQNTLYVKL